MNTNVTIRVKKGGPWDNASFSVETDSEPLTENQAEIIQRTLFNMDPLGYGLHGFIIGHNSKDNTYTARWTCSHTCD